MELTTFLMLLIIFIIAFSLSFFIEDTKYRISYYMIMGLSFLAVLNMYLSVIYYIDLRNSPGVPGPQGDKGPKGVKGSPGKCSFTETCKIEDARKKILKLANTMYNIPDKCLDKPSIKTCGTQNTLEQASPINAQINMLEKIAYSTNMGEKEFMNRLEVCLQDSNSCMDPTEF